MQVAGKKLLVAAKTRVILFDDWRCLRAYNPQANDTKYISE